MLLFLLFCRSRFQGIYVNSVVICTCNFIPFYFHGTVGVSGFLKNDSHGNISGGRCCGYVTFVIQKKIRINSYLIKGVFV